jgi:hypothetical protein
MAGAKAPAVFFEVSSFGTLRVPPEPRIAHDVNVLGFRVDWQTSGFLGVARPGAEAFTRGWAGEHGVMMSRTMGWVAITLPITTARTLQS